MLRNLFLLLLLVAVLFFPDVAVGQQQKFEKRDQGRNVQLTYEWRDHFEQSRSLSFELEKRQMSEQYRSQTNYMPDLAMRYVYISLMKHAQSINPRDARIRVNRVGQDLRVSVRSSSSEMVKKWQQDMQAHRESAFDEYLKQNHYTRFNTHMGEEAVKPDHMRYVRESLEVLLPLAQAIYDQLEEGTDSRDYVNLLLSWVQSIPYDRLENRATSNGAGYFSPIEVLNNNRGDCDSKTVLTATLMRTLLPNLSMVMIFLPNHALLGANLPMRETEQSIEIDGMQYLLLEPTGPAKFKVGEIGVMSANALAGGMYTHERVP